MSKTYKVRNGLKYQPVRQYNPNGTYRATEIVVSPTSEPDTGETKASKWIRFKLILQELGRGAAYAIRN
jgi:hypothetical protein